MVSFHWCVLSEPHIEDALQREKNKDREMRICMKTNGQVGCAVFVTMHKIFLVILSRTLH